MRIADAPIKGDPRARVGIIEYSDFHCPFCQRFAHDTLPNLEAKYLSTGKALLAWRHLPIESIHPAARAASVAADCAGQQSKFWEMHDAIFSAPERRSAADLLQHAATIEIDHDAFGVCVTDASQTRVDADMQQAAELGITGTPTFLVGIVEDGHVRVLERLTGAQPIAVFERVLERILDSVAQ